MIARAAIVVGALTALVPSFAWALCPNCLGQTSALTPTLKLIGVLLLLPFVVAALSFRAIRRACRGR
ncbi:MAG: hypothetical protein ABUS79_06845 [Pseudomonadota bacterium]